MAHKHQQAVSRYFYTALILAGLALSACSDSEEATAPDTVTEVSDGVALYSSYEFAELSGAIDEAVGDWRAFGDSETDASLDLEARTNTVELGEIAYAAAGCRCPIELSSTTCAAIKAKNGCTPIGNDYYPPTSKQEPHLVTSDGTAFDSHARGVFWLLKDTTGEMQIQAEQRFWEGRTDVAYNAAIAVQFGEHVMTFSVFPTYQLTLDGALFAMLDGQTLVWDGVVLERHGESFTFITRDETFIFITLSQLIDIEMKNLTSPNADRFSGLFGNFNEDPDDDLDHVSGLPLSSFAMDSEADADELLPSNIRVKDAALDDFYENVISPWVVTEDESLFEGREYLDYVPPSAVVNLLDYTAPERLAARDDCLTVLESDSVYLRDCVLDRLLVGDELNIEPYGLLVTDKEPIVQIRVLGN